MCHDGLVIASSRRAGVTDAAGKTRDGAPLTIGRSPTAMGPAGAWINTIGIALFAFSTILGWEYYGGKSVGYLVRSTKANKLYQLVFSLVVFLGATTTLQMVWNISDTMNGLMAIRI